MTETRQTAIPGADDHRHLDVQIIKLRAALREAIAQRNLANYRAVSLAAEIAAPAAPEPSCEETDQDG